MAAHLFSPHLCAEAVELLVASVFAHPHPFAAPASPWVAFLRFLHVLATHAFDEQPLIVDADETLTQATRAAVHAQFNAARESSSHLSSSSSSSSSTSSKADTGVRALWLATPRDPASQLWTRHDPSPAMLKRVAAYAASSLRHLTALVHDGVAAPRSHWMV